MSKEHRTYTMQSDDVTPKLSNFDSDVEIIVIDEDTVQFHFEDANMHFEIDTENLLRIVHMLDSIKKKGWE